MRYTLSRVHDHAGDNGGLSQAIDSEGNVVGDRPTIGCCMKVGSLYARTYSTQDWWMTTPVTSIIVSSDDYVVFKTKSGSTYEWSYE